jgi:hypothetical protein
MSALMRSLSGPGSGLGHGPTSAPLRLAYPWRTAAVERSPYLSLGPEADVDCIAALFARILATEAAVRPGT